MKARRKLKTIFELLPADRESPQPNVNTFGFALLTMAPRDL